MGALSSFFDAINNIVIPYWLIHVIDLILNGFRTSRLYRLKHPGHENWALVTGASDGIGEGFSHELAERGFNVILHGRNPDKIKKKEASLKAAYPQVKTRIWIADASEDLSRESILKAAKGLHLTLLINNVGGLPPGHPSHSKLEDQPFDHIDRTVAMNLGFTTKLNAALLPILLENQPSGILNISSLAQMGAPYLAVYSGSKGYINAHSLTLRGELSGRGEDIVVHAIQVGKVSSNSLVVNPSFATPTSRIMAKATLDNIGLGSCCMVPYLPHRIQASMISMLPESLRLKAIWASVASTREEERKVKSS